MSFFLIFESFSTMFFFDTRQEYITTHFSVSNKYKA